MAKNKPDTDLLEAYQNSANGRGSGFTKMEHATLTILANDPEISVHGAVVRAEQMFQILASRHKMAAGDE